VSKQKRNAASFIPAIAAAAALLSAIAYATAPMRSGHPVLAAPSVSQFKSPAYVSGTWYWIQQTADKHAAVARLAGGQVTEIAREDTISALAADASGIAYIGGPAGQLQVKLAGAGASSRALCPVAGAGTSVVLNDGWVYWTEPVASTFTFASSIPALSGRTVVKRVSVTGGAPVTVGTLFETGDITLSGVSGGRLIAVCHRSTLKGITSTYALPANGGEPVRISGTSGMHSAAVTADGAVWSSSAGRAASNPYLVCSINRVGADGRVTQYSDWLPANGTVFAAGSGVVYLDGTTYPSLWKPLDSRSLPQKFEVPRGFVVLAAAGSESLDLLLRPEESTPVSCSLYQMKGIH
jgi:hypothetical protein